MKYLLIRHGKTDQNRLTMALFGAQGAALNDIGLEEAKALGKELEKRGFDLSTVEVAASEMLRTQQTAKVAGIPEAHIVTAKVLNEITTPDPQATMELLDQGKLPRESILAARILLAHPPKQPIWFSHGLLIGAICQELGLPEFIPKTCEIIEIEL